jgi:hypothetical protein
MAEAVDAVESSCFFGDAFVDVVETGGVAEGGILIDGGIALSINECEVFLCSSRLP